MSGGRRALALGIVAVLVGLAFGAPHLVAPRRLDDPARYTPLVVTDVSFLTIDETYSFGARVREVMDGRWLVSDTLAWEHKATLPFYVPPEQWLLGAMARVLGGVPPVYVVADFLFPPIVFVLLAGLLAALTGSWALGAGGALAVLAGGTQHAIALAADVAHAATGLPTTALASIVRPLEFSRLFVPELTFIPLAAGLWALVLAVTRGALRWAVVAGLALAILIPAYLYYWMVFAGGVAVLLLVAAARRDRARVRLLAVVLALGLAGAAPYLATYLAAIAQPGAAEASVRFGVEHGRFVIRPSAKDAVLVALTAAAAWWTRSRCLGVVLAVWIAYLLSRNVQVVTGYIVQTVHWSYRVGYIWQTVTIVTLLATVPTLLAAWRPWAGALARRALVAGGAAGVAIGLVAIAGHQIAFARNTAPAFVLPDGYREAFDWINRSTSPDSVVVSPSFETNMLLPVYTHANVYLPNGNQSLAPTAELVERLLLVYKAFGVSPAYLAASLREDPARDAAMRANGGRFERARPAMLEQYARWYVFHLFRPPDALVDDILGRYDALALPATRPFGRYRADYVWMSPVEATKGRFDPARWPGITIVYEAGGVTIAKIGAAAVEAR